MFQPIEVCHRCQRTNGQKMKKDSSNSRWWPFVDVRRQLWMKGHESGWNKFHRFCSFCYGAIVFSFFLDRIQRYGFVLSRLIVSLLDMWIIQLKTLDINKKWKIITSSTVVQYINYFFSHRISYIIKFYLAYTLQPAKCTDRLVRISDFQENKLYFFINKNRVDWFSLQWNLFW